MLYAPSSHNKRCVLTHLACEVLPQKTRLQLNTTSIRYFVLEHRMSNDVLHTLLKLFEKETLCAISHAIAVEFYLKILLFKLSIVQQTEHYRVHDYRSKLFHQ